MATVRLNVRDESIDRPVWRLIDDGARDGARNMAVDLALLESRAEGECPPTLRLYRWLRPTLSIGRFQKRLGIDDDLRRRRGIDLVRRPTGGRGVLHDDEVTYSVVASVDDGVPRGTAASYEYICSALVEAYLELGVPATLTHRHRGDRSSDACYLATTRADLSLGAAKLSGSAQVWRRDTVLQHGSFVITRDVAAEAQVFGLEEASVELLRTSTATISAVPGSAREEDAIRRAATLGFERALGVRLECGELTARELARAESHLSAFALS